MAWEGEAVTDLERGALRAQVYGRLEREGPRRWEELLGCTVRHASFGTGIISKVLMPDWSNPVHLVVTFGERERTFHLSSFGDRSKFPENDLPAPLASAIALAEQEIAREEGRLEEDRQRRAREARETVLRREGLEEARLLEQRQARADQEVARRAEAEGRMSAVVAKADQDQPLTAAEVRLLVQHRRHELLLGYFERAYARACTHGAIVQAATTWRGAGHPEYALRVTDLLLPGIDRLPAGARTAVYTVRAEAFLDRRDLVEAKESALRAIACAGTRPQPYQLLGAILMAAGDMVGAERQFAKARELAGVLGVPRFEKAQVAEIHKQLDSPSLEPAMRRAYAQDLLRIDPHRYRWVEAYLR